MKLDYADPKVGAPPFNMPSVASLTLALLGMILTSPPATRIAVHFAGRAALLLAIGLPVMGLLLGLQAEHRFQHEYPQERGFKMALIGVMLNAIVLLVAIATLAIWG